MWSISSALSTVAGVPLETQMLSEKLNSGGHLQIVIQGALGICMSPKTIHEHEWQVVINCKQLRPSL
jgi:hypothetical protein